jgi:site-specific recombinase XerD
VLYAIAKAGVRAGLPLTVNVHMLRHSVATAMIEDGLADKAVAQILGHADPRVVALYTHPSDEYKAAAIERHGERFRSLLAVGDESPETY